MLDVTPLFRIFARRRSAQLEALEPLASQEAQLLTLVRKAKDTRFGRDHHFASISSIKDYQAQVPLRRYEDFWESYWKASFPNLKDCTWPGLIPFYSLSSGTASGTTKYIPCSREMLSSNTRAGMDLLVHHVTNRPKSSILGGKSFMLGGSTDLTSPTPGVFCGDLSGIAVKTMPWWARQRYFPPQNLALLKNWEEKVAVLAARSVKEDIRMISGVPAWLLIFFDHLLKSGPASEKNLSALYRSLEMVVHGGVNFEPYVNRFREILSDTKAELREVYPASEGFVAMADRGYGEGLRLNLDIGIFFEFVPLEELKSSNPVRHTVGTIEPDVNYAVVMTTCAGLWSYVIGDTVRFIDTATPRVLVTGRTSYYLSAFGEHLIGEEIEAGIVEASKAVGIDVGDFSVGAIYPSQPGELGGHVYVVEFLEKTPTEEEVSQFTHVLDSALCARNEDYDAHRAKGFGLKSPIVEVMPPGGFAAWMKARGKLGGQNKVPRIITDQTLLAYLRQSVSGGLGHH